MAADSIIGLGLGESPYQEMKRKYEELALFCRIAHDGYPLCDARWGSYEEMMKYYDEQEAALSQKDF